MDIKDREEGAASTAASAAAERTMMETMDTTHNRNSSLDILVTMSPSSPHEEEQPLMNPPSPSSLSSPSPLPPLPPLSSITPHLYTSHFLSTWNSRLFEFAAILFLASAFPESLLPLSLYALVRGVSAMLLSPALGPLVDTGDRLAVVRGAVVVQRGAVAVSCGGFWGLWCLRGGQNEDMVDDVVGYWHGVGPRGEEKAGWYSGVRIGLLAGVMALACVEKLAATLNTIAVERDWVAVLTANDVPGRTKVNGRMRQIDLFCKLLGPLAIAMLDSLDTGVAIIVTGGLTVLSVLPEYGLIAQVYHRVPTMQPSSSSPPTTQPPRSPSTLGIIYALCVSARDVTSAAIHKFPSDYLHHTAFLPSFSLALLYLTVLSFSGQMVAFLLAAGFSSAEVGVARMVSSGFELSATVVAPRVVRAIGPVRGGIWALSWQTGWLGVGLGWFFWHGEMEVVGGKMVGVIGLVVGVVLSRVGLWGYDLAAQIIIQDEVEEHQRGSFSTLEASTQNFFELVAFATTAIFHRPDQFHIPALISFGAVAGACLLYTRFVKKRRGHLFHAPACLKPREHMPLRNLPL